MKSLLVDALRQANSDDSDADQALSDSGSFDATNDEFDAIANDDAGDAAHGADADLSLLATSAALELPAEPAEHAAEEAEEAIPPAPTAEPEPTLSDAEEELRQTTELVLRDPDEHEPVDAEESHAITIVGELPKPMAPSKPPVLARLTPILCIVLAAAVGSGWYLYQKPNADAGAFGAKVLHSTSRSPHTPGIPDAALTESAHSRFPFLTVEAVSDVERTAQ